MVVLLLASLLGSLPPQGPGTPPALRLELDAGAFGEQVPLRGDAFAVLSADADGDGDPDLLVNWHVFAPPVLLWNDHGRFAPRRDPPWSLPEQAEVPILDAPRRPMMRAIEGRDRTGVYLWHSDRVSAWWFVLAGPFPEGSGDLLVELNRPILGVQGLEAALFESVDERHVRVPLSADSAGKRFYVATSEVGVRIAVRIEGARTPFFVGPGLTELEGPLAFWFRDPHGLAWVDATGDRLPDLFVTRGALRGDLEPPAAPKFDHLYLARPNPVGLERVEVPGDWARGRAAQWVDLEGDGRLELYTSAKSSPNRLLRLDAEKRVLTDGAAALGLDFHDADAFAWLDLDGDGDDDLVTLDARHGLLALRNEEGQRFEPLDANALGLHLAPQAPAGGNGGPAPEDEQEDVTPGIDEHDLLVFDLENDGDLDLLVTGWKPERACVLFRAEPGGFVEATREAGLDSAHEVSQAVVADLDGDGLLDLALLGDAPRLLRNRGGRFEAVPLPEGWEQAHAVVGSACDADGDGRLDLVLAGRSLVLARNRGAAPGRLVWLDVRAARGVPIGALVRACYADGSVRAARVGSTHAGHLSQAHGPIPLATPEANPLRALEVRFPGGQVRRVEVSGPGTIVISADG